ncbi:putative immunity protein [Streptomyces sp. NPDC059398]|uniref:putative immunity protein n=1 Tax=Streptomyces sp. NPDC059398 TaxID=3346820 RepID=UPI00369356B3
MAVNQVNISDQDRRLLGVWAADCAERVLRLFEAEAPHDIRPREAIEGIRAFARGEQRKGQLRPLAYAALAAAREVRAPAATAAARAAGYAAAAPYIHPLATPHQAKHALAPAMYVALARELAVDHDIGTGINPGDEEARWAIGHAPEAIRGLLRQMPAFPPGRSRLDALRHQLDSALRL